MVEPDLRDGRLAGARVPPLVPLVLLEALKSTDTPDELLEDEDLQQSFPRRLGLSDAVDGQIRRYRELRDRKAWLGVRELTDLFGLVARRPDAPDVFEHAGEQLALRNLEAGRVRSGLAGVPLPRLVRERLALRTTRRVADQVNAGTAEIRSERSPVTVFAENTLAAASGFPQACGMMAGALRASLAAHSLGPGEDRLEIRHHLCELRGDRCCLWRPAT